MRVRFHGAAGEVTGSMHEVEVAGQRVLLDCGMIQGNRACRGAQPRRISVRSVASGCAGRQPRAHRPHRPRAPAGKARLRRADLRAARDDGPDADHAARRGIAGRTRCRTRQSKPPRRASRKSFRSTPATMSTPRCGWCKPLPYDTRSTILPGVDVTLRDAGHILGSSIVELHGDDRTLVFSGDLGPNGTPILRDPDPVAHADLVVMESTYGDRDHKDRAETISRARRDLRSRMARQRQCLHPRIRGRAQPGVAVLVRQALGRLAAVALADLPRQPDGGEGRRRLCAPHGTVRCRRATGVEAEAQSVPAAEPAHHRRRATNRWRSTASSPARSSSPAAAWPTAAASCTTSCRTSAGASRTSCSSVTRPKARSDGAWSTARRGCASMDATSASTPRCTPSVDSPRTPTSVACMEWYGHFDGHPPLVLVHGEDKAREALAGEIGERNGTVVQLARPGMTLAV